MSIFKSIRHTKPDETSSSRILGNLAQRLNAKGDPLAQSKVSVFSMESMDEGTRAQAEDNVRELRDTLTSVIQDEKDASYDETQVDAAQLAAVANSDRKTIFARTSAPVIPAPGDMVVNTSELGSGEYNTGRLAEVANTSTEAYDNTENRNAMMLSFTYNLKAARQDEFGEAFFPTVICDPDMAAVNITIDLLNVSEDYKRKIDGTYQYQFGRKTLVAAIVEPTILNNDTTRIYPIYRSTDPVNVANFVDVADVPNRTIRLENEETVITSPLKVGAEFDLIGLGSADYLISAGQLDRTDALDPSIQLATIYIKLKSGDVFYIDNLQVNPDANYVYSVNGNNKQMLLNFDNRFVEVNKLTKKVDGSPLTGSFYTNDQKVRLNIKLNGSINLETAVGSLNFSGMKVLDVYAANGDRLDLNSGVGQTTAQEFEDAKVIGYDLIARRVNTNRRERGQLLDINRERMVYSLPILAPISVVRPAIETDATDDVRLDRLITTTYIRCSNAAVRVLLAARDFLSTVPDAMEPERLYNSATLGAARYYVKPYFQHTELDVENELNSLRTGDRIVDVQAVLVNTIRDMVYRAYLESNYRAACDVLLGDTNKKPLVVIGTDPYIAAYLMVTGDLRTLGDQFEVKVVSTPNKTMRNKIIMAFGKGPNGNSDVMNPLHFGNMFWRPELVSILNISRNNTHSKELTVQPSFLHVVHCPIMMSVDVKNLPKAVTKQAPIVGTFKQIP